MNTNDTTSDENEGRSGSDAQSSGLSEQGRRETAQIEQEIAQTRAEMSGTLDQIHGKLNPTALKERAVTAVRDATVGRVEHMVHSTTDTVKQTGATLLDTVKRNPVPTAMIGVGAAWLVLRSRNGGRRGHHALDRDVMYEPDSELGDEDIGGESGREASQIRRVAGERMRDTRERMHGASERMQRWKQDAQQRGRQLEYRAQGAFEDNPLLVGAAVVAAGALVGLAIPITRGEDSLMGRTRDGLVQQAQARVQGALDKVQQRSGGRTTRTP